jgi:hypothetical protein
LHYDAILQVGHEVIKQSQGFVVSPCGMSRCGGKNLPAMVNCNIVGSCRVGRLETNVCLSQTIRAWCELHQYSQQLPESLPFRILQYAGLPLGNLKVVVHTGSTRRYFQNQWESPSSPQVAKRS